MTQFMKLDIQRFADLGEETTFYFYKNDGTGTYKTYGYNETNMPLPGSDTNIAADPEFYTRDGYTFAGWSALPAGGTVYTSSNTLSDLMHDSNFADLKAYAVWEKISSHHVTTSNQYYHDIANAIRSKTGSTDTYTPANMSGAIEGISTGTDTSDATLNNNSHLLSGYTAYANGTKYTGSMANQGSKTFTPSTNSQTSSAGYYSGITVNAISTQTKTATPSTSSQTISPDSGKYLSSVSVNAVTSSIDSNIKATNIKKGVSILGVTGTMEASADVLNGVIEQYKTSGGTISANNFVEFVNGGWQKSHTSAGYSIDSTQNSGYSLSAVLLSTNKVFIAHCYGDNYYLYGIIVTCEDDGTMTKGTNTALFSNSYDGSCVTAVALDETRVFIGKNYGSDKYLYGAVVTISGSNISVGSQVQLCTATGSGEGLDAGEGATALKLSNTSVLVTHPYTRNTYYLYGIVCNISGTSVSKGTDTLISDSSTYVGTVSTTAMMPNGSIFLSYAYSTSSKWAVQILRVSGTSITVGTETMISSKSCSFAWSSVVVLDDSRVFMPHSWDASNLYLYGMILSVSGTTITANADVKLTDAGPGDSPSRAVYVGDNRALIVYSGASGEWLYSQTVGLDGTTVTPGTQETIGVGTFNRIELVPTGSNNRVYVSYESDLSDTKRLGQIMLWPYESENTIQLATTAGKIAGITKGTCTEDTAGDVWVIPEAIKFTVTNPSSSSYTFELNSDGYYESNNKGVSNSYAYAKVSFNLTSARTITVSIINYAESNYDYGQISNLNSDLAMSTSGDSSVAFNGKGNQSADVKTITFDLPAGSSYFTVKYLKDGSVDNNNDSLQFKIS